MIYVYEYLFVWLVNQFIICFLLPLLSIVAVISYQTNLSEERDKESSYCLEFENYRGIMCIK